jgi:hypothetical protein
MKKMRFLMPVGFLALAAGLGAIVMLLWNWLMRDIFGLITINFWQALGLLALAKILFGGFGGRGFHGHGMMHGHHNHIREKWMKMSAEERKKFVEERRRHACGHPFGRHDFFDGRGFDVEAGNSPKEGE